MYTFLDHVTVLSELYKVGKCPSAAALLLKRKWS